MSYQTTGNPEISSVNQTDTLRYTQNGTLTLEKTIRAEILVVGGGGSGGTYGGGAGGGGGVVFIERELEAATYDISIGIGGASPSSGGRNNGNDGSPSLFSVSGGAEIIRAEGGQGAFSGGGGAPGGSAGGGQVDGANFVFGGRGDNAPNTSGGGGGASQHAAGNTGGDGRSYGGFEGGFLFGAGGAGQTDDYVNGSPGLDGGGAAETAGAPNSGGGGGGSWASTPDGPINGGSGVVFIRLHNVGSNSSSVSGSVLVDSAPAERIVRAFGYYEVAHAIDGQSVSLSKSLGQSVSDPVTGEYSINLLGGYGNEIFVVAFDDYGDDFIPGMSVNVGDRVHPATPNGYVFECIASGTLPSSEPAWITDTESPQIYGSASMIARSFYRPMVHGPVKPVIADVGTPWTPSEIVTALWLDADDPATITTDSGSVTLWADKSGSGRDASQNSTPPSLVSSGVDFNGSQFLDISTGLPIGEAMTVFEVFDRQAGGALMVTMGGSRSSEPPYSTYWTSGTVYSALGGDSGFTTHGPSAKTGRTLHAVGRNQADVELWQSGATIGGTKAALALGQNEITYIGRRGPNYANGTIREIVVVPDYLGTDDRQTVEGYLAHKWGIAGDLPANHPYKDSAPTV